MRRNKKVLIVLIIFILTLAIMTKFVLGGYNPIEFFSYEIDTGRVDYKQVKDIGGIIVGIIQVVGTIVSISTLVILGIKYMMGSAEEKAEYKKTLFPYFIGAVLIFATTNITQVIYKFVSRL